MNIIYNNGLVCDLEPNNQEQMPVEESGNMVSILMINSRTFLKNQLILTITLLF